MDVHHGLRPLLRPRRPLLDRFCDRRQHVAVAVLLLGSGGEQVGRREVLGGRLRWVAEVFGECLVLGRVNPCVRGKRFGSGGGCRVLPRDLNLALRSRRVDRFGTQRPADGAYTATHDAAHRRRVDNVAPSFGVDGVLTGPDTLQNCLHRFSSTFHGDALRCASSRANRPARHAFRDVLSTQKIKPELVRHGFKPARRDAGAPDARQLPAGEFPPFLLRFLRGCAIDCAQLHTERVRQNRSI